MMRNQHISIMLISGRCAVHHGLHYVSRTTQNIKISCMYEWIVDTMKEKFTKMVTLVSSFCLEAAGPRQWRLRKRDWENLLLAYPVTREYYGNWKYLHT